MNDVLVLAGFAGLVALMIGVAAGLEFRGAARLDVAAFAQALALYDPGAHLADAIVGEDGAAALGLLTDGKIAAARRMGDRIAVRMFAADAVTLRQTRGGISASFADLGFPALRLKLADPPRWLTNLAGAGA